MKLEQQVVSLEQAQKLKELGVKQESLWSYCFHENPNKSPVELFGETLELTNSHSTDYDVYFAAFTVAELISMLQSVAKEGIFIASGDECVADTLAGYLIEHYAQKSKI